MRRIFLSVILALIFASGLKAETPFYQGKTITFVTGTTPGSQYDAHARLIAQHWGKHIPGNPQFIVQNMPGAGSLIAANHLYNVAKPDGLTVTSIIPAIYFNQLAGRKEVRFDYTKFNWIGSVDRSDNLVYMRSDAPFKTIYDVRSAAQPPKCTATGTGTIGHYMPKLNGLAIRYDSPRDQEPCNPQHRKQGDRDEDSVLLLRYRYARLGLH
jgi:tripartite-type tricarboxylate transporter receptor subunit TctC